MEAELQAERAAAEAEADRVKAAIEEKRREREQVEAALRTAVRSVPSHFCRLTFCVFTVRISAVT